MRTKFFTTILPLRTSLTVVEVAEEVAQHHSVVVVLRDLEAVAAALARRRTGTC